MPGQIHFSPLPRSLFFFFLSVPFCFTSILKLFLHMCSLASTVSLAHLFLLFQTIAFSLPPLPFCLICSLLNQSYIQVEQCPILSNVSISSHSVSPRAICPLHLCTVSFLCLQLCLKVILCLPLSYSFSSLSKCSITYIHTHSIHMPTHTHLRFVYLFYLLLNLTSYISFFFVPFYITPPTEKQSSCSNDVGRCLGYLGYLSH